MSNKIYSAFDEIHMSEACQEKILKAMHRKQNHCAENRHRIRVATAAACLMATLLILCNPTVVEALENSISSALEKFTRVKADGTTEIRYQSFDGKFQAGAVYDSTGNQILSQGRNNLLVTPEWYVEQDNRVYFAGNGEWIDVTDLIDLDTPFTYTYTDQNGIIHYICIGGVYDPDPEIWNVGYAEWYYDPNFVHTNGIKGNWIGGYCDNYWDKNTGTDWLWLQKAKQEMGIPWPSFSDPGPDAGA